jgi:hypothetical protein
LLIKPKGKGQELDLDKGKSFFQNIRELTKGLDRDIAKNKTLLRAIYGNWRDTFLGFPLDKSDYKYLIKNNKKLSFENAEDLKLINDFLNEASAGTRDQVFTEEQAVWVSDYTKELIKQYKKSLAKNKPKGNSNTPNSASKIRTRKNRLMDKNVEQDAQNAWNDLSEHNETNNLLAKVLISTYKDYYHNGPGTKTEKLKSIIISLVSNRNSVNGFRSLSNVVGVVWSPDKVAQYHMEHTESIASVVKDILLQIILPIGSEIKFNSTSVLIPKEIS